MQHPVLLLSSALVLSMMSSTMCMPMTTEIPILDDAPWFRCPQSGGPLFPDPQRCDQYIVCMYVDSIYQRALRMPCPRGLYFRRDINVCDYPANVDCSGNTGRSAPTTMSTSSPSTAVRPTASGVSVAMETTALPGNDTAGVTVTGASSAVSEVTPTTAPDGSTSSGVGDVSNATPVTNGNATGAPLDVTTQQTSPRNGNDATGSHMTEGGATVTTAATSGIGPVTGSNLVTGNQSTGGSSGAETATSGSAGTSVANSPENSSSNPAQSSSQSQPTTMQAISGKNDVTSGSVGWTSAAETSGPVPPQPTRPSP